MKSISILFVSWRLASHVEVQGPLRSSFDVTQMQPPNGTRGLKGQKFSGNQSLGYRFTHPMAAWNMCNTTMLRCHEKVHVTLWHFLKPDSGERVNKELSSGHDFLDDSCQCYRWQCYQYLTAHSVWLVVWRNLIVISHHCTWIFVRFILMTKKHITKNHKTKTFPNISRHVEPSSTKKR